VAAAGGALRKAGARAVAASRGRKGGRAVRERDRAESGGRARMATGPSPPGIWRTFCSRWSKFSQFQSPSPLTGKDFLPSPSPNGDYVPDGAFDPDKSPKNLSTEGAQRRKKGLTRRWGVNGGSRSRLQNGDGNGRARRGRAERARLRSGLRRLGERGRDARRRRLALGLGERKGEEASAWGSAWRWRGRTCCAASTRRPASREREDELRR